MGAKRARVKGTTSAERMGLRVERAVVNGRSVGGQSIARRSGRKRTSLPVFIESDKLDGLCDALEEIQNHDNTKQLLANNITVYTKLPGMAKGVILKTYPDGQSETVSIDSQMNETVLS